MIDPVYNRTSSDTRMTAEDMNRICANINEVCGASLKTTWTSDDIVDEDAWLTICRLAAALGRYPVTEDADYINVNYIERSLFDQYDAVHHITASPKLTSLSISNGSLSPTFSASTYSYTATVSELTSVIAAATDYSAIGYVVNRTTADPAEVTWKPGANTLQVTATLNGQTVVYTVTVTCTYQAAGLLTLSIGGNTVPVADYMTIQTENASDAIAYTANGTVTLELNGQPVTGGTLNWQENDNALIITVTADDTKVYTVSVNCTYEAPVPAMVSAINISDATMLPAFAPGTTAYSVYQSGETSTIEVIVEDGITATIYVNDTEIANGAEVTWTDGGGDVLRVVTASGSGYTGMAYTITGSDELIITDLAPLVAGEFFADENLPGIIPAE